MSHALDPAPPRRRTRWVFPALLYAACWCSTAFTYAVLMTPLLPKLMAGATAHLVWPDVLQGLQYAVGIMSILTLHEMGHYVQSVRYGVPASLPLFIPMPITLFGTMGAVIFQQPGVASRRVLFDIAISGPLGGLVVTIPLCIYGLMQSQVQPLGDQNLVFGDPLLLRWLAVAILGPIPPGSDVVLNPWLFAGWVGLFITALNLLPIGQLDGGHLLYALLGRRRARIVATLALGLCVLGIVLAGLLVDAGYFRWMVMVVLLLLMGPGHPPTAEDPRPLGLIRRILGWLTLAFVLIGLTPLPIVRLGDEPAPGAPAVEPNPPPEQPSARGGI